MRKHGRSEDFESTEIQFPIKKKVKTGEMLFSLLNTNLCISKKSKCYMLFLTV